MRAHHIAPRILVCPSNCGATMQEPPFTGAPGGGAAQLHTCRAMGGLSVPLVAEGQRAIARINEREDYIGNEHVTYVNDRPVMSVEVEREDGNDAVVYAPMATTKGAT